MGKWHIGAKPPTKDWFSAPQNSIHIETSTFLSDRQFNWSKPLNCGAQDIGFDSSLISTGGIQEGPYNFFRDGKVVGLSNITNWSKGTYSMPEGTSMIAIDGEGASDWDSTAYNMILVNETARFLDDHEMNRKNDPFFACKI